MARTEGDTDLATAALVAAARAAATNSGLIHDPFAEPLVRAADVDFYTRVAGGQLDAVNLSDDGGFARLTDLCAVRTRFFDHFLADAGIAGIRQAVMLGSGLDARPYRMWWPARTMVFDIDRPQLVELKTQTLRRLGVKPTGNRRAVGVDFRQDWSSALRRVGFDTAQPSAWIVEGLLVADLPIDAQDRLLDDVTALTAGGSRFAAEYRSSNERSDVARYLAECGWETVGTTLERLVTATGLSSLRPEDLAESSLFTRYVTAVRNAPAPATLDS